MNVAVFALLFGVMTAVAAWAWRRVVELRRELRHMEHRLERAQRDALDAEARSRGVGGRGEHGAPMVTRLNARSLGESIPTGGKR